MRKTNVRLSLLILLGLALAAPISVSNAYAAKKHAYVGSQKCKKCHTKEYKSWAETNMADAFDLLKAGVRAEEKKAAGLDPAKDYTKDKECLPCHVTGYGEKGGFVSAKKTPDHLGVGCETCHGPGGTYIEDGYMTLENKEYKIEELLEVGMIERTNQETCESVCHNNKSPFVGEDYVFDYEAKRDEGNHALYPLKFKH